jgi:hypothetical protein
MSHLVVHGREYVWTQGAGQHELFQGPVHGIGDLAVQDAVCQGQPVMLTQEGPQLLVISWVRSSWPRRQDSVDGGVFLL